MKEHEGPHPALTELQRIRSLILYEFGADYETGFRGAFGDTAQMVKKVLDDFHNHRLVCPLSPKFSFCVNGATLKAALRSQDQGCNCVCHKVGLLGFMCCPCTTRIFQAVANEGGNNVSIRSSMPAVPGRELEVSKEGRERDQRGDSVSAVRNDSRTETATGGQSPVKANQ